jgi:hypothetical protein
VHRGRVHALVDDPDVEGVRALSRREDDVVVGDGVEVDPGLRVLALDPVADVLGAAHITRALDRDRQIALILMRRIGRLVERHLAGAGAVMRDGGLGSGGDHESQPQAGESEEGGSARENAHGLRTRVQGRVSDENRQMTRAVDSLWGEIDIRPGFWSFP